MVDYPLAVHLHFFGQASKDEQSKTFLLSYIFCGTPPSCLKVMGGWHSWLYSGTAGYIVVAYKILVLAPVPLELIGPLNWV